MTFLDKPARYKCDDCYAESSGKWMRVKRTSYPYRDFYKCKICGRFVGYIFTEEEIARMRGELKESRKAKLKDQNRDELDDGLIYH